MTLDSAIIVMMMIQLVFLGAVNGWRWLDHPVLRLFGQISYSLYLYHIVVIAMVYHFLPHLRIRWSYPIIYLGSAAVAYISYRVIERPFLRLKDRFTVTPEAPRRGSAESSRARVAGNSDFTA
jgi:peptidoglycan/LPS O-acetylase OafA/YrhL